MNANYTEKTPHYNNLLQLTGVVNSIYLKEVVYHNLMMHHQNKVAEWITTYTEERTSNKA